MPAQASFDITSTIDFQEVDNALNQARKEIGHVGFRVVGTIGHEHETGQGDGGELLARALQGMRQRGAAAVEGELRRAGQALGGLGETEEPQLVTVGEGLEQRSLGPEALRRNLSPRGTVIGDAHAL